MQCYIFKIKKSHYKSYNGNILIKRTIIISCIAIIYASLSETCHSYSETLMIFFLLRYGRRPIMSICIILMACTGFICAFFPQKDLFGFWPSYIVYTISRFILACSTRGIAVTGFVLGNSI